jgi:hypothetical protein
VLGALVVDRIEVVRTPDVHVAVEEVRAYLEGFELRLAIRSRSGPMPDHAVVAWRNAPEPGQAISPPRLGLGFADGVRLTNLSPALGVPADARGPLLVPLDVPGPPGLGQPPGRRHWVWGLPPRGPLTVAVEVPALGVPETTVELDGEAVRAAGAKAELLWDPESAIAGPLPWSSGGPAVFVPEPQPAGPPPEDEDGARSAVALAFAGLLDVEGDEVVNVEGGAELGPTRREVLSRFGSAASGAVHQVERITFVDASSAAVVFSVWVGGSPYLLSARGDAVLRDGRWLVARSTFCGLLARVGVACPP